MDRLMEASPAALAVREQPQGSRLVGRRERKGTQGAVRSPATRVNPVMPGSCQPTGAQRHLHTGRLLNIPPDQQTTMELTDWACAP